MMRLVYISVYSASTFYLIHNRLQKPFNSLLGETFEVVTPEYRAISEQVSHHPPMAALYCQGENYTLSRLSCASVKFTGKAIWITDTNKSYVTLKPKALKDQIQESEAYTI